MALNRSQNFVKGCLNILYQAYFRPFSYRQLLRKIHSDLDIDKNPFRYQPAQGQVQELRQLQSQIWWTTLIAPIVMTLFVSVFYQSISSDAFNYQRSLIFFWVG